MQPIDQAWQLERARNLSGGLRCQSDGAGFVRNVVSMGCRLRLRPFGACGRLFVGVGYDSRVAHDCTPQSSSKFETISLSLPSYFLPFNKQTNASPRAL